MTTVKHWLEAIVGNDTRFQVVCDNPTKCAEENEYDSSRCIFVDQFKEYGVDMIAWPIQDAADIIVGRVEVKADISRTPNDNEPDIWIGKPE